MSVPICKKFYRFRRTYTPALTCAHKFLWTCRMRVYLIKIKSKTMAKSIKHDRDHLLLRCTCPQSCELKRLSRARFMVPLALMSVMLDGSSWSSLDSKTRGRNDFRWSWRVIFSFFLLFYAHLRLCFTKSFLELQLFRKVGDYCLF